MVDNSYWTWTFDNQLGEWRLPYPHVYKQASDDGNWIGQASNGKYYSFPDVEGGWHMRKEIEPTETELERMRPELARDVVHRVGADSPYLDPEEQPFILAD